MRSDDGLRFKALMATLYNAYSRKPSDKTNTEFWQRLRGASIEKVEEAVNTWIDTKRSFPRVSDLRDLCGLNPSPNGPSAPRQGSPYARQPPDIVAFCVERGFVDPHEYHDRYNGWQRPEVCRCPACRRANCTEGPALEPRMVELLDGRRVEMGFELHGDDLNEYLAARDAYRLSMRIWSEKSNVITFANGSTVTFGKLTPDQERYVATSETFEVYAEDE